MIVKKSLVMLGIKDKNQKAVLNMESQGDMIKGKLRLYNFNQNIAGILSIGFYCNNNVLKAGLNKTSSNLFEFIIDAKNINDDFSCAVINTNQGEISAMLYGNSGEKQGSVEELSKLMTQDFDEFKNIKDIETVLDENNIDFNQSLKNEIDKEIDKAFKDENNFAKSSACSNFKYKSVFLEKNKDVHEIRVFQNQDEDAKFYDEIKNQIENLFEKNQKEEYLESLIPNSKWVKVEYADDGDYYIVGLVYEDDKLLYIVYGVPGVYSKIAPKEIAGKPVWFPLDSERPESFGYWLSYQDAQTGESVEAFVE